MSLSDTEFDAKQDQVYTITVKGIIWRIGTFRSWQCNACRK